MGIMTSLVAQLTDKKHLLKKIDAEGKNRLFKKQKKAKKFKGRKARPHPVESKSPQDSSSQLSA